MFRRQFRRLLDLPLTARLRSATGIDRAIFYTVGARSWSAVAGPISLLFVAQFLTKEEQGFYYTFTSILGLQLFFELGLAYVIMQSASHEKALLAWSASDETLTGDAAAKARLASLFRLALKWYAAVAVLGAVALTLAGLWFFDAFQPSDAQIAWRTPWLLLVGFTVLNLLLTPFIGIAEGCGKIAEIASLQVRQGIGGSLAVWVGLGLGLKLYVAPLVAMVSAGAAVIWLVRKRRRFFVDLIATPVPAAGGIRWRDEILPFQWKIALSWLSGYFIFHLMNPVLFRYHGATEAGRMGMTMRIIDSITALGFAWVSTKSAPFGSYIARRDFATLDAIFNKAATQSAAVVTAGCLAFLAAYQVLAFYDVQLLDRLLDPTSIAFLAGTAVLNCIVFSQAVYLRAHKQEPFLFNSLLGAVLMPGIAYFIGKPYGARGIAIASFVAAVLIGLPLATSIFYRKRRQWHSTANA